MPAMGFRDLLKRRWTLDGVARPWPARASIYEHLRAHTKDGALDGAGRTLPGANAQGTLEWAPGAKDGVLAYHMGASTAGDERATMVRALLDVFRSPTAQHLAALYTQCESGQIAGYVDVLVDDLNETPGMDALRVHTLGTVLATEAPHVEAVKLGIALLGMIENDDRALLVQLGLHDELTMFAVTSLMKQLEDFEPTVFELAKHVHGWGRIHAVERLAATKLPAIKSWLLRDGFRNDVMDEYLAHTCATTGELHRALAAPDQELLRGAAGIFRALAAGGPAADLADYEHASAALDAWLPHVKPTLDEVAALDALTERTELTSMQRQRIEALRTSDTTRTAIDAGLQSPDETSFALADIAARARGIATFELHEKRVLARTDSTFSVFRMMQEATEDTIERALVAAAGVVDGDSATHRLFVLQELTRFAPGTGAPFVLAALRSHSTPQRALATRVMEGWGKGCSAALREALVEAAEQESDDELKTAMERVLDGNDATTRPALH